MTTKVWNLMYALGSTDKIVGDSGNPLSKKVALEGAAVITKNRWRCWVQHHATGKRVYENPLEVAHRTDVDQKRIIKFAEDNVPGFATIWPPRR